MSKFIVVIVPDETKAYEGSRAFRELHAEGSLTLYGMAIVAKTADGKLSVKQAVDEGPLGTAVGSLSGGLIGLLGGPVGAAIGLGAGALLTESDEIAARVDRLELPFDARGVDDYGVSKWHLGVVFRALAFLYRTYFHVKCTGLEHIPARGRAMAACARSTSLSPRETSAIGFPTAASFCWDGAISSSRSMATAFIWTKSNGR